MLSRYTESHKYGRAKISSYGGAAPVKTTVEISDDLYWRAEATAALWGRRLSDLIEEGLLLVLEDSGAPDSERELAALWQSVTGIVESGLPDLASNPEYLTGFGRVSSSDR
jgi:hypothetical protein